MRAAPWLTATLFLGPLAAGLAGTLLPAFGYLPALGGDSLSLDPWRALLAAPGLARSVMLTLGSGLAATLVALLLVLGFCAVTQGSAWARRAQAALAPVLATPHAALAIGFAFLVAPSGWLARLASPWATGWDRPPDLPIPGDPWGLALVLGLVLKEVPYLLLMAFAALGQVPASASLRAAAALGHRPVPAWFKLVLPQIYPQLRLPICAVLAFSLSVVDVALILGPGTPPTLAVLVLRWFGDRDLALWFPAAAGAVLLLGLVLGAILAWRLGERAVAALGRRWIATGHRGGQALLLRALAPAALGLLLAASLAGLAALIAWSLAGPWRFPEALPAGWTLRVWRAQSAEIAGPARATLLVAVLSTLAALGLVLAWLESGAGRRLRALVWLPLLLPQLAFLFGWQVALVRLGLDGTLAAVVWTHLLFVLPYVLLSLADPWAALDPRYARSAAALGAGPWRVFWAVKLRLLLRPLLVAAAVGFAVSVGLYLPTLFAGAGRITTLTTEAVTLAAGADRRVLGAYAALQAALPLLAYALAAALPAWLHRHRQGMRP
ncbi:ABC transporter permease [Falsiroseomonas selenitidurans]|uniref:ABC transporter permease subunit n=1 Tax=Falsiroseomonas selenitidurans TaxID=2716335 RepID=A0ABX1ECD4_9PROT|nr:ABC transporter permease subunit [Falsiroseomonas selenitidurans]NKC33428.1 ABC transporter permease subunit [Falsiroseomonas selenitidurans]